MSDACAGDDAENRAPQIMRSADVPPAHKPAMFPASAGETGVNIRLRHPVARIWLESRIALLRLGHIAKIRAILGACRPPVVKVVDHLRLVERQPTRGAARAAALKIEVNGVAGAGECHRGLTRAGALGLPSGAVTHTAHLVELGCSAE
jgi:hypothetical protein